MADVSSSPPPVGGGVPPPPPNVDDGGPSLAGLQPIPAKKTLMVLNSFIINTVDFLNKFNAVSEQKLLQAIQRVEITLALLEGKLESVPWLNGDLPPPSSAAPNGVIATAPPLGETGPPPPPPMDSPPPPPQRPQLLLKDDERYKKFFKMISMGVPPHVLRAKVESEGLDPSVLDMDPEGPAPDGWEEANGGREEASGSDSDSGDDSD